MAFMFEKPEVYQKGLDFADYITSLTDCRGRFSCLNQPVGKNYSRKLKENFTDSSDSFVEVFLFVGCGNETNFKLRRGQIDSGF